MDRITQVTQAQMKSNQPAFDTGDQVRVWCRITEKDRVRQVPFEGLVVRRRGSGPSETFTVRRITHGEGVERVFPVHAPIVERIDVLRRGKVRRGRLYFLRKRIGKTKIAPTETSITPSDAQSQTTPTTGGDQPSA